MFGTHKMNFRIPPEHMRHESPMFETYACPAGSVLIFTEAICHAGSLWQERRHDRLAIFNCYNRADVQYHKMNLPPEVIAAMPPKRRTLFRGVWGADFRQEPPIRNDYYAPDNQAL